MTGTEVWKYGVRVEMLRPGRFVWVLTSMIEKVVSDIAESAVTYSDSDAAAGAGNAALKQMLANQPGSS